MASSISEFESGPVEGELEEEAENEDGWETAETEDEEEESSGQEEEMENIHSRPDEIQDDAARTRVLIQRAFVQVKEVNPEYTDDEERNKADKERNIEGKQTYKSGNRDKRKISEDTEKDSKKMEKGGKIANHETSKQKPSTENKQTRHLLLGKQ